MADRPACGFRWKRHHENHKQLYRVEQTQVTFLATRHISPSQLSSSLLSQSHACSGNRCITDYLKRRDLQIHQKHADTPGGAAAGAHRSFTVRTQQCTFVHRYVVCKRPQRVRAARDDVISRACQPHCNTLSYVSTTETEIWGKLFFFF